MFTEALVYGHFGPKTFRHWCQSVHWTFRHHRKNTQCRSVCETLWHRCRSVLDILAPLIDLWHIFQYKETSTQQTPYYGDANGSSFIEADGFVFCFAESPITNAKQSVLYLPSPIIVITNAVSSNWIVIYWQLTIVSRNYRRITDASVGTNVISSLLTAVAFLCFPTYYVCCRQCVTAHT